MLKCQFIIAYTERLVINFLNGAYIHNGRYEKPKTDLLPAANSQPARSHTVVVLTSSHILNQHFPFYSNLALSLHNIFLYGQIPKESKTS